MMPSSAIDDMCNVNVVRIASSLSNEVTLICCSPAEDSYNHVIVVAMASSSSHGGGGVVDGSSEVRIGGMYAVYAVTVGCSLE